MRSLPARRAIVEFLPDQFSRWLSTPHDRPLCKLMQTIYEHWKGPAPPHKKREVIRIAQEWFNSLHVVALVIGSSLIT